jgi:DNA-binding MarR family transcriptional regulator
LSPDDVLRELARVTRTDLGRLVANASRAMNIELMRRLAGAGHPLVRPSHLAVFAGLEPGGSQITALAQHAGVSRQALSSLVREVESLGYVRTSPDPADRRAVRVELTDVGVAFCLSAIDISTEMTREIERVWGSTALDETRERLRFLASATSDDAEAPPEAPSPT